MISSFRLGFLLVLALLAGCSSTPPQPASHAVYRKPAASAMTLQDSNRRNDVVMYAFGLINVDYRFGGANPESGLDCSGMVSYIYENSVGLRLPHNAARIAGIGRQIPSSDLQPGDLVFFNTMNRPYSHVGIYIGDERFIHAPHSNGKIEIGSLKNKYFAQRFDGARSFFN
jgi:cell wall-associated NlpC family hydrolase